MLKTKLKLLTGADFVLIILIVMCSAGSYFYLHKNKSDLNAYIYYHNNLFGIYSLSTPQTIIINSNNKAEIKHGKIRMLVADCPDKRCVLQGWSDLIPIICLPNQIVIEIKPDNHKPQMHILQ